MSPSAHRGPHARVVDELDQLLDLHPARDAEIALDLREGFLRARAGDGSGGGESEAARLDPARLDRGAIEEQLRELRGSFYDLEPGAVQSAMEGLDLRRFPDLGASAERLLADDKLRVAYGRLRGDRHVPVALRRAMVDNVVLPIRQRRREISDLVTLSQPGQGGKPGDRGRLRAGAKRVLKRYPELKELHGWWLRDLTRLPRWNPLLTLFRVARGLALNYLSFVALLAAFLSIFAAAAVGHGFFRALFNTVGGGFP